VRRHPLIAFVILTYALTWALTIPFVYCWRVVLEREFAPWLLVFFPAPFGPTFAALIMAWRLEGREGLRRLLGRLEIWRVGAGPWLVAIFLSSLTVAVAVAASGAGPTVFASFSLSGFAMVPVLWLLALPFGPLPEELGWRGWFLPRLQSIMSPFKASVVVGVVWTFWHTPMFWFPGAAIPSALELSATAVLLYLAQIVAEAILFTVLFNRSNGSVLLAIVFHTAFNTAESTLYRLFESPTEAQDPAIYYWTVGLTWLAAVVALSLPAGKPVSDALPERSPVSGAPVMGG
jgi:membrane protease YdiL (CAAX protease family)